MLATCYKIKVTDAYEVFYMSTSIIEGSANLGEDLAELRKATNLTQADIAKKLKVDQSRISRIEKGGATLTSDEIEEYLKAIGTEKAEAYAGHLKCHWKHLECPSFWHPQRDELCKAEMNLQKLEILISQPQLPKLFINQAQMYGEALKREAKYISSVKHSIAFAGPIGVGKTTAICKLTKLVISQQEALDEQIALETGAGGTTACEVHIQHAEKFGLLVEPQSEEEINKIVEDFCAISTKNTEGESKNQQAEISKETIRILRNMTALVPTKREGSNGKREKFDPLKELVDKSENSDTLRLELLDRMKLQDRNRRKVWFEGKSQQTDLEWLKQKFADINCGREKDFPLPQRIDVCIPYSIFGSDCYELELIDTKGVDGTANRPDIRQYIDDSRTLTVLCSSFSDAPNQIIQDLIEKLIDTGSEGVLRERIIILLLPQQNQSLSMKDDAGYKVKTKEEGYELKQEQVQEKLEQKCNEASNIPVFCFNADSDDPQQMTAFFNAEIEKLRNIHVERLLNTTQALDNLIKNQEEKNARKAQQEVMKILKLFLDGNKFLEPHKTLVNRYLRSEMNERHPRKIWASIRRKGIYNNLNIYFLLGSGARSLAWNRSRQAFWGLKELIKVHMKDPELQPVNSFLEELLANWEVWYEEFLTSVQQSGEEIFKPRLMESFDWYRYAALYGLEVQFTSYVNVGIQNWFESSEQEDLHNLLNNRIDKAWQEKVLINLEKLTDEVVDT
jgi:transcriptional regulator with XRE-family HTH domain/GTPase SAR1 family protein